MVYFSLLIYERVIAMNQSIQIKEDYADNLMLTKEDMKPYDVDRTFEKVMEKLKEFKIARNKYINGYHARLTPDYSPKYEMFTNRKSDPVGTEVEFNFDNELAYNEFNYQLNQLYSIMSKIENAYINDCLLCGKSEVSVRDKFGMGKDAFRIVKDSAIIRFGIVFNIVIYK